MTAFDPAVELPARAAALVPLLREHAKRAHDDRRVAAECLAALRAADLLRMSRPRRYGGFEVGARTKTTVFGEIARGCGSTAWVTTLYEDAAWLVSMFPDEVQDEVFGDRDALVTATLIPVGRAERRGDEFVVNGRWPFNTGCLDADWVVEPAIVDLGDGGPEVGLFLMPYAHLTIEDDWSPTGLRATGSNGVTAIDEVVPAARMLTLADVKTRRSRSQRNRSPVHRIPVQPYILTSGGATLPGLAKAALEIVLEQTLGKPVTYTTYAKRADAPLAHLQIAEAAMKIRAADLLLHDYAALVDRKADADEPYAPEEITRAWATIAYGSRLFCEAIESLRLMSGARAIDDGSPIALIARNAAALATHAMLVPGTGLEQHGRVLCGLSPASPFL